MSKVFLVHTGHWWPARFLVQPRPFPRSLPRPLTRSVVRSPVPCFSPFAVLSLPATRLCCLSASLSLCSACLCCFDRVTFRSPGPLCHPALVARLVSPCRPDFALCKDVSHPCPIADLVSLSAARLSLFASTIKQTPHRPPPMGTSDPFHRKFRLLPACQYSLPLRPRRCCKGLP